jgi:2-hydroxychromene-2-carboxylate isomerase
LPGIQGLTSAMLEHMVDDSGSTIEVFADVGCPFTHVGLRRFMEHRTSIGRADVLIRVRPWPLELVNGHPLDPDSIADQVDELRATVAPDLFGRFDPTAFPATSIPAMALAEAAYRKDTRTGESMSLAIRDRLFEEGSDISDPIVLQALAQQFDLSDPSPDEGAVGQGYKTGKERGVIGSPHFFTPDGSFFCPALDIERDLQGQLQITVDDVGFRVFLDACFS